MHFSENSSNVRHAVSSDKFVKYVASYIFKNPYPYLRYVSIVVPVIFLLLLSRIIDILYSKSDKEEK